MELPKGKGKNVTETLDLFGSFLPFQSQTFFEPGPYGSIGRQKRLCHRGAIYGLCLGVGESSL